MEERAGLTSNKGNPVTLRGQASELVLKKNREQQRAVDGAVLSRG
jgi:hypothetical protein